MHLLVGLGNPGDRYASNRHNIGFMAVEKIADAHGFAPWRRKFSGQVSEGEIGGRRILLLKPETYMNESGRSVGEAARFLKIDVDQVIVFHDELDLLPGKVRCKSGGGNAGHNGLKSITAHIGNDYRRVRLGIGHPGNKDAVASYVLHDFAKSDTAWLEPLLDGIAAGVGALCANDDALFLNEIAKRMDAANPTKQPAGRSKGRDAKPLPSGAAPGRHPTGERGSKRQSALADNLKNWLRARDVKKTDNSD